MWPSYLNFRFRIMQVTTVEMRRIRVDLGVYIVSFFLYGTDVRYEPNMSSSRVTESKASDSWQTPPTAQARYGDILSPMSTNL